MMFLLCFFANSACDKIFELDDKGKYNLISTSERETICFRPIHPNTLLLFKHIKDYIIKGYQTDEKQKLVGFYFGPSAPSQIELTSTKSSSFSYISSFIPTDCQSIEVSTLKNDQVNFTTTGKIPSCYFHSHKNSTYAVTIDADDDSLLIGLRNGMKFVGKMNDFIRSTSELFIWVPSKKHAGESGIVAPKASIVIGMPNKHESHHGFKISLTPDQFLPIFVERNHHHENGKDHHHNHHNHHDNDNNNYGVNSNVSYGYPPKFNYNNVYQNGNILFPSILHMIVSFVFVFLLAILIVRLFLCFCNKKKSSRNNRPAPSAADVPPVEFQSQISPPAQLIQPQNVQIIPIQGQQQYHQLPVQQQQCVYYPNLQQPQFIHPQVVQQQQIQQPLVPQQVQQQYPQQLYYI